MMSTYCDWTHEKVFDAVKYADEVTFDCEHCSYDNMNQVVRWLKDAGYIAEISPDWERIYVSRKEAQTKVESLPPVVSQPKMGHWINAKVGKLFPSNDFKCSECGNILNFDGVNCGRGSANFCPNCGARMEGVTNEESST